MRDAQHHVVAIDLGGTAMRAALVGRDGRLRGAPARRPTQRLRPPEAIIDDLVSLAREFDPVNVGLGVPTPLDDRGRLRACDNLPTMNEVALAEEIQRRTGWHVRLFHDAACFTVGEWRAGMGRGLTHFCGVTLGTGIGLGIVAAGRLVEGAHRLAGEIWRSPLDGAPVEDAVSGPGLTRLFQARTGRSLPGEEMAALADAGDADALAVFAEFGRRLGWALAWIANGLDPEAIALGGSVACSLPHFEAGMRAELNRYCSYGLHAVIGPSVLGEAAALIGAGALFFERCGRV